MSLTTEFRPIATIHGGDYSTFSFQEEGGVAQTFASGNVVVVNAEGRIQEAVDGDNSVLGTPIMPATGVEGDENREISCYLFDRLTIFEAPVETETTIDTDDELQALIGDAHFDLTVTTGRHFVSTAETADDLFCAVGGDISDSNRLRIHVIGGSEAQWITIAVGGWTKPAAVS